MLSLLLAGLLAQDGAAFARPAMELAALQAPRTAAGADTVVLFEENEVDFQADGRQKRRFYLLYRILTDQGAQDWTSLSSTWAPWYQKAPVLKARVIAPGGTEHWLDPKTIAEGPAREKDSRTYSDRRASRAPLPAIAPGAVVEAEIIEEDTTPFFAGGTISHYYMSRRVPVERSRLIIHHPSSLPVRWKAERLARPDPERSEKDGVVTLRFEHGPAAADEEVENHLPPELLVWPSVAYSTGESWNALARQYAGIVDQQIAGADVGRLTRGVGGDTRTKIRALVARLHDEVRYEAVELGEASLVPRPPRETLQRKFGDCKDKSALLVAMLRHAGIPAHMALLSSGYGRNPDADLPGFGQFDHAIVYVPGEQLFIDPTDPYTPVGELPLADQGRLTLVASAETRTLLPTPESTSAMNRIREVREFTLVDNGKATVVETSTSYGSLAASDRSYYSETEPKKVREQLEKYVKEVYLSDRFDSYETKHIKDLGRAPQLVVKTLEATRGSGDRNELAVAILPASLTDRLPAFLRTPDDEDDKKPRKKRQAGLMIFEPVRYEWHYRITAPRGFKLRDLPASSKITAGGTTIEKSFAEENGLVTATLACDTGRRRLTAVEAEELREKVLAWRKSDPILIYFDQGGEKLLRAGDVKGALAEFRQLAAAEPNSALQRTRIARAYLAAGLGESARREARQATGLEPKSVDAWTTLASVLEHDLIGRFREPGLDWHGAVAAWEKAVALEPANTTVRANYAIALEYDPKARRYSPESRVADAITQYRKLKPEELDKLQVGNNLGMALLRAGKFDDLLAYVNGLSKLSAGAQAQKLAALALTKGPAASLEELSKMGLNEQTRATVLASAGQFLLMVRRYPEAGRLLGTAAQGAPNAAQRIALASMLANTQRVEELDAASPVNAAKKFLVELGLRGEPGELATPVLRAAMKESGYANSFVRSLRGALRQNGLQEFPLETTFDLALAMARLTPEGSERDGMRVRIEFANNTAGAPAVIPVFLTHDAGRWKVAALAGTTALAREILRRVDSGELDAARQWLDWTREEYAGGSIDDPVSGPAFARLWRKGQKAGIEAMRVAAASLAGEPGIPIIAKALAAAAGDAEKTPLEVVLAAREDHAAAVPYAERLLERYPESDTAFALVLGHYDGLKRWDDIERLTSARLKRQPGDKLALAARIDAARDRNDPDGAARLAKELVANGKADAGVLNNLAWLALVRGRAGAEDLDFARRAAVAGQNDPGILHTMAAVYALAGNTTEARQVLLQTLTAWGLDEPNGSIWLVAGLIAEQFNAREEALAAYKRVAAEPAERKDDSPASNRSIARARLKAVSEVR